LAQTRHVVHRLCGLLPRWTFEIFPLAEPGDQDRVPGLESPADFFTHDLDFAVHPARDMPDPIPAGLDWFWLPWRDDPCDDRPTSPGQGAIGLSFRIGDRRLVRLRSLFVRPVVFVGAGAGAAGLCTADGLAALKACDLCIHDALLDSSLLAALPANAERIDVGKRAGHSLHTQTETTELILRHARRGRRLVRLKGGDPGLFGRLAEETEALEALGLPFRVIPGVSSLNASTTGSGMMLTRRGVSQGFCAITARMAGGKMTDVSASARSRLPVVFFMAGRAAASVTEQLRRENWPATTPAAAVFAAGTDEETIVDGTLANLASRMADSGLVGSTTGQSERETSTGLPVLLICGDVAGFRFRRDLGALRGKRVLLTFSEALQESARRQVLDYGGIPVSRPMIRFVPCLEEQSELRDLRSYDWVVLTSSFAVDCLMKSLCRTKTDLRGLPRLLVSGPGTMARLETLGLQADAYLATGSGLLECVSRNLRPGERVLRLRSNLAGAGLSDLLRELGLRVDDVVLYRTEPVGHEHKPRFDIALFAGDSAVESLIAQWGPERLEGKLVAAFPGSACAALAKAGISIDVKASERSVEACIGELALYEVSRALQEEA